MRDLTRRFIRERRRRYIRKGQDLRVPRTRDTCTRTRFIRVTRVNIPRALGGRGEAAGGCLSLVPVLCWHM
jgi:hypothetical protein